MSERSRICFTVDSDLVEHIIMRLEATWGIKNASVNPIFSGTHGEYLKMLRKKKKMTQQQLATLSGVHQVNITMMERNKRTIGLKSSIALGEALGVNPLSFLMEE